MKEVQRKTEEGKQTSIYNFTFTNTTYAEGNYTKDEGGKVSLSNDAVYKMSTVESYVLNYGTIGEEENRESNPGIILVLPCLILLWPIGLASYIREKISKQFYNANK